MKTQPKVSARERTQPAREAVIVAKEPARDEWTVMTWRDAGELSFTLTAVGLAIFGLHYLAYGTSEGKPPRDVLVTGFLTVSATLGGRMKTWKVRGRFLAGLASAMAIMGLFFRFVVHDPFAFSPHHIAAIVAILVLIWLGIVAYKSHKFRRA